MSNGAGIVLRGEGFGEGVFPGPHLAFDAPYPDVIHIVKDRETGRIALLDEAEDRPKPTEDSFAFRLDRHSLHHACPRYAGAPRAGWYVAYALTDEPVPDPPGKQERTEAAG